MSDEEKTTQEPEHTDADGGGSGQQADEAKFTQSQLNAIIADRLKNTKNNVESEFLKTLGVEDLEAAAAMIKQANAAKEAEMSEVEKLQAELEKARQAQDAAEALANKTLAEMDETLLQSAIFAKSGEFNDPVDVWLHVDRSKIEKSEDGQYTGIEDAIDALKESKPYLLKDENKPNAATGTQTRGGKVNQAWESAQQRTRKMREEDAERPRINF